MSRFLQQLTDFVILTTGTYVGMARLEIDCYTAILIINCRLTAQVHSSGLQCSRLDPTGTPDFYF